jgi:ABC-type cobalamin/Fe3+-siderophores transport system ATPase subunit
MQDLLTVLLLLLQPTSGLDSFGALSVMGYLQQMARAHSHTIITTIHQPRSQIFQMFDVSAAQLCGLHAHGAVPCHSMLAAPACRNAHSPDGDVNSSDAAST